MLEANVLEHWQPDTAFLDLVRDREVASALLVEVIGKTAAASFTTDTAKRKREIIASALAGKNRAQVKNWCRAGSHSRRTSTPGARARRTRRRRLEPRERTRWQAFSLGARLPARCYANSMIAHVRPHSPHPRPRCSSPASGSD